METERYYTHILPNGLRVIHQYTPSQVAYCGYAVNAGSRDEDAATPGMAHFIEHMLFKGTVRRKAWHILNRMEHVGGDLNAFTNKEETVVYCAFMKQDLSRAVELLSDLVFHSVFPEHEIEKEREVIIDEIKMYEDSPAELIFDDFEDLIYSGHPLGRNILGNAESLRKYGRADADVFYHKHYQPDNMVFFVLGNYDLAQVVKELEKHTHDIPAGETRMMRRQPTAFKSVKENLSKDTHQAHVMIGGRAYDGRSPKRIALNLINNIMGGPGMNSRLNVALREHRGLVYEIESNYTPYTDTGTFSVYFGCDHEDVDDCVDLVYKELRQMREHRLTDSQLRAAKKQLIGQIGVSSDNHENNALGMAKTFLHYNRFVTSEEAFKNIELLSADQLQEVAQEILAESNLSILHYGR
ncbi:MAG: insulinase family protein [Bacteroidaceae bacterium]|nr:insulinase family protein [Bacteroidaceae bacterium]